KQPPAPGPPQVRTERREPSPRHRECGRGPGMIAVDPFVAASMPEVAFRAVVAVAIAVVTTSISLRLLGARRGWTSALLAGILGWGTAGFLALALNRWDWGAD